MRDREGKMLMRAHSLLILTLCAVLALLLGGCGGGPDGQAGTSATNTGMSSTPPPSAPAASTSDATADANAPAEAGSDAASPGKKVAVVMETSMGTIELELYPDKAPI